MSFSNIDSLNLGQLLQIVFSDGVRNQISVDFRDFEMVKRAKVGNSVARELRFMFQTSLGAGAVQYHKPSVADRAFPAAQQVTIGEKNRQVQRIERNHRTRIQHLGPGTQIS